MAIRTNHNGSELHRLKPMQENYDNDLFNEFYKLSKPVIKKLSKQIDPQRFDVTRDIIESYFWDKMIYIFNKYYGTCSKEHLRARVLGGLSTFKNHLLHSAYTERAEFNQSLHSFEDLFENSNEDRWSDEEEDTTTSDMLKLISDYMVKNLQPDDLLVFEALYNPPKFIKEYPGYKLGNRITNIMLLEFFELPKNTESERYIRELRENVDYWIDRARRDLHI